MLTYRINKHGTLILEKDGVYFGLTPTQIREFLDILMEEDVMELLENTVVGDDLV